jgi:hypothetical protein
VNVLFFLWSFMCHLCVSFMSLNVIYILCGP